MLTIDPKDISVPRMHGYLLGAVTPRPIAFVSTMDKAGNINLSPFSFFNTFSANPPVMVFSPSRRAKDNTTKHTLENVLEHPECVINMVDFPLVEQMSLASAEYEKGINEFKKAGLSMKPSIKVKPPRVGESPASFECKVLDVISLGKEGGAGNLVVCEVLLAHFQDRILDKDQRIDPHKLDVVARLGGDWYCRVGIESIFEITKPSKPVGIGIDQIPARIRNSSILTGNNLGKLGNAEKLPAPDEVSEYGRRPDILSLKYEFSGDQEEYINHLHLMASQLLELGKVEDAWKTLLQFAD